MADELEVKSPYDGSVVDRVPAHTAADVVAAVGVAKQALDDGPLPAWRRAAVLDKAAAAIADQRDELATIISREAAKPLKTARVEVDRAVSTFTFSAAVARRFTGETIAMDASQVGEGKLGFTLRVPIGVVGAITPFNFPLNLVAHKVAPAIAAGCPVVCKPASQTPRSAMALRDIVLAAGLPPEHLHVLPGSASQVGNAIVDDERIPYLTFTGSAEVGWDIRKRAFKKKVALELGNNAPVIIEPSADLARAAAAISVAGFSHAGQSCISTQRVLVHASVLDAFANELVPRVEQLVVGDPLDENTDVSPCISAGDVERVSSWIEEAIAGGARVLVWRQGRGIAPVADRAGERHPGHEGVPRRGVRPGRRHPVPRHARRGHRLANDTRYGLQAGIYTAEIAGARRPPAGSTSAACSSTRCRPGAPIRCRTAACVTAATRAKGRRTPSRR